MVLLTVALAGCGAADRGQRASPTGHQVKAHGAYAGDPKASPEDVVRDHVRALNERDGEGFCGSVAPYIAGSIDIAALDPDNDLPRKLDCPEFVHAFIGYVEDCCPPKFVRAEVRGLRSNSEGALVRVDADLILHQEDTARLHRPVTHRLHDVIWLARLDGAWRVARLSAVSGAASVGMPGASNERDEQIPLSTPPDVGAMQRAFDTKLRTYRSHLRRREGSFKVPGRANDCAGKPEIADPAGDVEESQQPARGGLPAAPDRADLRSVALVVEGDGLCVTYETEGAITGPIGFVLNLSSRNPRRRTMDPAIQVEMRSDGRARATNGLDARQRPVVVPASIGVTGHRLTLRIGRKALVARERGLTFHHPPLSLTRFAFSAATTVMLNRRREVRDNLGGSEPMVDFIYPGGRQCELVNDRCQ